MCVNSESEFTHLSLEQPPPDMSSEAAATSGLCSLVCKGEEGDCTKGDLGTFRPGKDYGIRSLEGCRKKCDECARCRFYSYSATQNECAWFHSCNRASLLTADGSYMTYARWPHDSRNGAAKLLHALPSSVSSTDDHPRADGSLPLLPFSDVERPLAREERRRARGVGPLTTPGNSHYGELELTEAQLDRGVLTDSRRQRRLSCFLSMAARRSSTVAAIGGSVTSGLPFGTFTGDDHANAHWLYHRKLARWLSTQWPRTQHDALNRSFNCGLPAVGPAFTTLCLHALLPAAPNLVLVEYAINVASASDVEWFELLIRKLLLSDPNLAIIVVSSFKLVDADRVEVSSRRFTTECMSEQHICEQSGRTLRHAPGSSSESAIERVCSHYGLPLVSLRRALSDDIGRPPLTIASFMKDCAHPNPQGHSFLAQLIVHALRRTAAAASHAHHQSARSCVFSKALALPVALPPPLLVGNTSAALIGGGAGTASCYHGHGLQKAVVASSGFEAVYGRKPGLRAHRAGSFVRLRVALGPDRRGAWAHVGYLQSYGAEMGAATLTCELPCTCNKAPLRLQGFESAERTSTTKIAALHVKHPHSTEGDCIVRLAVEAGAQGGTKFMLSDLISGSADPGPLLWVYDVAAKLLLHRM